MRAGPERDSNGFTPFTQLHLTHTRLHSFKLAGLDQETDTVPLQLVSELSGQQRGFFFFLGGMRACMTHLTDEEMPFRVLFSILQGS